MAILALWALIAGGRGGEATTSSAGGAGSFATAVSFVILRAVLADEDFNAAPFAGLLRPMCPRPGPDVFEVFFGRGFAGFCSRFSRFFLGRE